MVEFVDGRGWCGWTEGEDRDQSKMKNGGKGKCQTGALPTTSSAIQFDDDQLLLWPTGTVSSTAGDDPTDDRVHGGLSTVAGSVFGWCSRMVVADQRSMLPVHEQLSVGRSAVYVMMLVLIYGLT